MRQLTIAEARALARHAAMTAEAERAHIITEEARTHARLREPTGEVHKAVVPGARPICCQGYCPACGCCACCGYEHDCGDCDCTDADTST